MIMFPYFSIAFMLYQSNYIWDKVFKNGPSKICGTQPLKNLKGYGLLNTLSHIYMYIYIYACLIHCPIYIYIYIYIFTTKGFLEVAIETWPELDLNPRPLNSAQTV